MQILYNDNMKKGQKMTPQQRWHVAQGHLGQETWNKGKKTGLVPKTAFKKGHAVTKEWQEAFKQGRVGFKKGYTPWNKGLSPEKQPGYKSGKQKTGNGYIMLLLPRHPYADKRGRVAEHRYIMEQHLGRYLNPDEIIDHINEITDDNQIENLQIVTFQENLRLSRERKKIKDATKTKNTRSG